MPARVAKKLKKAASKEQKLIDQKALLEEKHIDARTQYQVAQNLERQPLKRFIQE